jgi:transglutaminase-like putative cysteine protease
MSRTRPGALRCVVISFAIAALAGCASRYFNATVPPYETPSLTIDSLPREHWAGIVFNGAKIGFAHTEIVPLAGQPRRFEIRSEASLLLAFLGFEKRIQLRSRDIVDPDLTLRSFESTYHIDGSNLLVIGEASSTQLRWRSDNAGQVVDRRIDLDGPVVPVSAVLMYPALYGLELERQFRFRVFDGETQQVSEVEQRVTGFETSELFSGEAYRVVTRMQGRQTTSWISRDGQPVFERALNGVLISATETEQEAKRYLAQASLNKLDVMLDFSLVRPDTAIDRARSVSRLEVVVAGVDAQPLSGGGQNCYAEDGAWRCMLDTSVAPPGSRERKDLSDSITVPWGHPDLRSIAAKITSGADTDPARAERILDWLAAHIRKSPADAFSALDVLRTRSAECQGHAYLYTALARASGVPTRVANGLVYSDEYGGFLYHSWAESLLDGRWVAVDPTFRQMPADATHIKLLEGEALADLARLADWVGRVSVRILLIEHAS